MKNLITILVIALLAAGGLAGGNYYLGSTVEKEYFKALAEQGHWGPFTLTNKSYERGFLSSKAQTVLEIADTAEPVDGDSNQTAENVKIVFDHTFWHGPLALATPGNGAMTPTPALVVAETKVSGFTPKNEELSTMLAEVPDLAKSNLLVTVGLDGHVKGDLKIPAFDKQKDGVKVSWGGFTMSVGMSKDKSKLAGGMDMPKLDVQYETGNFTIGAMTGKFDLTEALPLLYLGSSKVSLAGINTKYADMMGNQQELVLQGLDIDSVSSKTGNMVAMSQTMKLANLTVENATYGPALCTVEFKNLDAQALSDFQVQLRKIYTEAGADASKLEAQVEQMLGMYKDLLLKCLKSSPEMRISQLHLATSRGNADGQFAVKFAAPAEINLDNPLALLQHLESNAEISIQEKLLKGILSDEMKREMQAFGGADGQTFAEDEFSKLAEEQYNAQVEPLVEQKFVVREGESLKSSAVFKNGTLTVNGQQVPLF